MYPIVLRLNPSASTDTANAKTAPTAMRKSEPPKPTFLFIFLLRYLVVVRDSVARSALEAKTKAQNLGRTNIYPTLAVGKLNDDLRQGSRCR
jgi:hypothetical protein